MTTMDRRHFLRTSALTTGLAVTGGAQALAARGAMAADGEGRRRATGNGGYGPLRPTKDRTTGRVLLWLPAGFQYASFGYSDSWASAAFGRRAIGSDGYPTPDRHDGMAAFPTRRKDVVRLVRNHERGYSPVPFEGAGDQPLVGDPDKAYDRTAGGATTTVTLDLARGKQLDSFISINGTAVNCAGGPTPWGSWLTCEETTNSRSDLYDRDHGYIFEVPAHGGAVARPRPLKAMGRFTHEAIALDPATGFVYETEDESVTSGFYRFRPDVPGRLAAGGRLEMLAVRGEVQADLYVGQPPGATYGVRWVPIADPDPESSSSTASTLVFDQGRAEGGAAFARLEGCWWGEDKVYFNSTSGGDAELGQVWEYDPRREVLRLVFESRDAAVLDSPDNITVSPRGGLTLCEDGDAEQFVRGLTVDGQIFDFALNAVSEDEDKEFCGATFSPDGDVLFVNIQTPGVSFAITGPWRNGAL